MSIYHKPSKFHMINGKMVKKHVPTTVMEIPSHNVSSSFGRKRDAAYCRK